MMLIPPNSPSVWTLSKGVVRERVDEPLIAALRQDIGHPLSYFGLPAAGGEDLLAWRNYIGEATAVDKDARTLRQLADKMQIYCQAITVYERLGQIEDLIIRGDRDDNGQELWSDWDPTVRMRRWAYDLVNFDAYGTFFQGNTVALNRKAAYYKRAEAIRKLFERQAGHSFILLVTVPITERNTEKKAALISDIESYLEERKAIIEPTLAHGLAPRTAEGFGGPITAYLLAAIPVLLAEYSAAQSFHMVYCLTLDYPGKSNVPMLHIASRFEPTGKALHTAPDLRIALTAPHLQAREIEGIPALYLSEHQSPISNEKEVRESLTDMGIRFDE